jgi:hypothetical protein
MLADDRRKHVAQIQRIEKMLEETAASKNLSVQEREQLAQQLEDVRKDSRTKEQQLAHEKQQVEERSKKEIAAERKSREEWEKRFREGTVERDLMDAAVAGDAFNNNTVMDVLRPLSRLEEIQDEKGAGTGKFHTLVEFRTSDPNTGEPLCLILTARKAVERMQAEPARYGNLFKAGLRSGIGSSAGPAIGSGGKIDPKNMSQETYMKIRAENPALLGLRPQKGKR